MAKVGYRFRPTEQELLEYYLYNKITQNPLLYEDIDHPVRDWFFGFDDPWFIWNICGGNDLLEDKSLYFFSPLKKLSPKASRFNRRVATGVWQREDVAKPVLAHGSDQILGFRKRFWYENNENHKEDGGWIMHEFTINSSLVGQHWHKALDFVLCRLIRNESEHHIEKANLGKKPRKTRQGEETDSGKIASGSRRKLKEAGSPNSNTDDYDECFPNKRIRTKQGAVLVQQNHSPCSSITLQTVESEGEIIDSLSEDSTTVEVEGFLFSLNKILKYDYTEDHHDEGYKNYQQRGEEEACFIQQNQLIDLPCSNDISSDCGI